MLSEIRAGARKNDNLLFYSICASRCRQYCIICHVYTTYRRAYIEPVYSSSWVWTVDPMRRQQKVWESSKMYSLYFNPVGVALASFLFLLFLFLIHLIINMQKPAPVHLTLVVTLWCFSLRVIFCFRLSFPNSFHARLPLARQVPSCL